MKPRLLFLFICISILTTPGFAKRNSTEKDSLSDNRENSELTNEMLLEKIESLEVELEKLKIEKSDNGLLARGATLEWGKGWNTSVHFSAPSNLSIDFGYTASKRDHRKRSKSYPLSQSRDVRYTLALQGKMLTPYAIKNDSDGGPLGFSAGLAGKIGSPVMLNLISVTSYVVPFVLWAQEEMEGEFTEMEFGVDLGIDLEFWLTKQQTLSLGLLLDPIYAKLKGDADLFAPQEVKFRFGFRYFFK